MSDPLADLRAIAERFPRGTQLVSPIDDLDGKVIGYYFTEECKPGVVLQQNGKRIVHVYQTKWFTPMTDPLAPITAAALDAKPCL